jgi:3-phenylpropionate/trans-cinnamate dioxygenase ferredoxin subunit
MPFIQAATLSDFETTDRKYCELTDEVQVALFKHEDGSFYAIDVWCSHQKVSLINGERDDYEIICPLHGACFDIRNGQHQSLPAVRPVERFEVKLDGDNILVEVEE